jgi:very-short-patch-repair endonuclease
MRLKQHLNTSRDYRRARELRNAASPAERTLWRLLSSNMVQHKIKFRRQVAIHPFIVDFCCLKAKLVIELDGPSHDTRLTYDARRDAELQRRGFKVMRFTNEDIMHHAEGVTQMILAEAMARQVSLLSPGTSPLPNPPHKGEGTPSRCCIKIGLDEANRSDSIPPVGRVREGGVLPEPSSGQERQP